MMNINAKAMNELTTATYRKEADKMLLNIEATITERATNGYDNMSIDLQGVRTRAYEMIKSDLQEADFKVNCGQGKWLFIKW